MPRARSISAWSLSEVDLMAEEGEVGDPSTGTPVSEGLQETRTSSTAANSVLIVNMAGSWKCQQSPDANSESADGKDTRESRQTRSERTENSRWYRRRQRACHSKQSRTPRQ